MSSNLLNPRKPLLWLAGAAAAAAFFASGALVTNALDDDGGTDPSDKQTELVVPGVGRDGPASAAPANIPAGYGPNDVVTNGTGQRGGADASYPACRAPLPAGVVTASGIDPKNAGFIPALPATGFSAISVSLSSQGECDRNGNATSGPLVLDSSWKHDASGLEAYVSQRVSSEKVASVIREDSATFWANGYIFSVGVNSYRILPVAEDLPAVDPASPASSGAGTSSSPGRGPLPIEPDPRAREVLAQIIGQLAPDLDQKCFWTTAPGGWEALAAAGLGDPRGVIPSDFTLESINGTTFNPPAAGCDTSLKPVEGFNFNANFQKNAGSADFGYLGISVYSNGSDVNYPGQISEWGANWSNGKFQFGVYAKSEKTVGIDVIRAVAKALDPSFNEACFVQERELSTADLAALGFREAKAPNDWKLTRSSLRASEIASGCEKPAGFEASYNLSWTFEKGADVIDAGANRYGKGSGDGSGYQSPNSLSWTAADGTNYNVSGYSKGVNPTVSKDDMVAVAKSMDPNFDVSKLVEGSEGKPLPMPAPDERSARP